MYALKETDYVDTTTGEVVVAPEEQHLADTAANIVCTHKEIDYAELEKTINEIGDKIANKLERAKRYREQAERRSQPLENSAAYLLEQIKPALIELAKRKLPRFQSGKREGEFTTKTLNLESCRFAFRKDGGTFIANKEKAVEFCILSKDRHPELLGFTDIKTILADEKGLLNWVKERNVTDYLEFISTSEVDEFAKVKCEIE